MTLGPWERLKKQLRDAAVRVVVTILHAFEVALYLLVSVGLEALRRWLDPGWFVDFCFGAGELGFGWMFLHRIWLELPLSQSRRKGRRT